MPVPIMARGYSRGGIQGTDPGCGWTEVDGLFWRRDRSPRFLGDRPHTPPQLQFFSSALFSVLDLASNRVFHDSL